VISGERIVAVGTRAEVAIPRGATIIDCSHRTIAAGFWNNHIHFYGEEWDKAVARNDYDALTALMRERLLRYGFTHVVDTGSIRGQAAAIRRAVSDGKSVGPAILSAGPIVFPKVGPLRSSSSATAGFRNRAILVMRNGRVVFRVK